MAIDQTPNAANQIVRPNDQRQVPGNDALADATKLIAEVMKNEETRFSNLNTRGVAVISATSLVTAVAGFFSKDLLGTTLIESARIAGGVGTIGALVLLVWTAYNVVFDVLRPGKRFLFGNNSVLLCPEEVDDLADVNKIAYLEYRDIFNGLVERNTAKAKGLNKAYQKFFFAVLLIAATGILVLVITYFKITLGLSAS